VRHGDVAIVTGGASGIGAALARRLARAGTVVVVGARTAESADRARAELRAEAVAVDVEVADVTDPGAVSGLIARTVERHGRIDYLYNNAGSTMVGLARDMTLIDWQRYIHVNLYGVVFGIAAAYPIMVRQGRGHIINTASLAGLVPVPGSASYVAAKHGVVGLSNALRVEGAAHGVRVSVVCPALVETPIFDKTPMIRLDAKRMKEHLPGKPIAVEVCVDQILRGVRRNRETIPISPAGFIWRLHRYLPFLTQMLMARLGRKLDATREAS
jgi:NAD(P)-dependent dehydrogenase (short-subunit alcohol dehydrogenase family)